MSVLPLTIPDWRAAQLEGDGLQRLLSLIEREKENGSSAWISLASSEQLQNQWTFLESLGENVKSSPLWGVPFAVKDNIDVSSFITTAACPSFAGPPVLDDAQVVANLKAAGAILLGKTNLDQFATGLVGTRSPYGAVPNAFDPARVSGGSSSGSAVVVSRGVVPFSLGTDTAGSGRVPAGLNNIVGLKPTRGAISTRGVLPACRTLDCVSIFALTVLDAETVLRVAEGFDLQDVYSRTRPANKIPEHLDKPSIAICASPPWFGKIEQEMGYLESLEKARNLDWDLRTVDFGPLFALAQLLYEGPWVAERYEAIRDFIETAKPEDLDPVVRSIILKANNFTAADAFAGEYRRQELTRDIELAFEVFDMLLVPTSPTFPTIEEVARAPVEENSRLGTYTNFVNLLDWSALSIPAGFRPDGLPFGITLIARRWQEPLLLQLADSWLGDEPRLLGATGVTSVEPKRRYLAMTGVTSEPSSRIVVVGAHLSGLPLNKDLVERGATLECNTKTSAKYRLFALKSNGKGVQKPGLKRTSSPEKKGAQIEVEVWRVPTSEVGSFMSTIPHPLGIGSVELNDGTFQLGFICEPLGLEDALEITGFGGWKAYLASGTQETGIAPETSGGTTRQPPRTIRKVLIANRGEIAVRIIRTLHSMGLEAIAIYSEADAKSLHVRSADVILPLGSGSVADTYLNASLILKLALSSSADAIIPGYGFLAENADFAEAVEAAGLIWVGPRPEQMRHLGLKHVARSIAYAAGVPIIPGSDNLLNSVDEARKTARRIGYPIMLKSTAGGGGIGLRRCDNEEALVAAFEGVQRLAQANFGESGVFLEHFVSQARHIEVQVIGDGTGQVVTAGDRDCSLQRRHQKLVEEAPAPILPYAVRDDMKKAAVALAASVKYRNVGTVEFIYDTVTNAFYFLEVNTRLQVEHPVTESVTNLDLVECMLRVARGDSERVFLKTQESVTTQGASIEVRLYAESPLQQFRPSSGRILDVYFPSNIRVETWIERGTEITSLYDPLLAKLIAIGTDRRSAVKRLVSALAKIKVIGLETNLEYLREIISSPWFSTGEYITNRLDSFEFRASAIEVIEAGPATTIQDYPGRTGFWHVGIPPSGPMDDYSFRIANQAVGNAPDAPALEATLQGPKLRFLADSMVAVTGATGEITVDGEHVHTNRPFTVRAGQTLSIGAAKSGYRFYVAIRGGFAVPSVLGSRSTFELGKFGGHNGRKLQSGDVLRIESLMSSTQAVVEAIPSTPIPSGTDEVWMVGVIPGPHGAPDFFTPEGLASLLKAEWKVHYNSNRLGVRLTGPKPQWARKDGGQAGLHPSNIHDAPYSIGSVSFTGDEAIILTSDGPSLGGFVALCVIADAEMWKIGQVKPGDRIQFVPFTVENALEAQEKMAVSISTLNAPEIQWVGSNELKSAPMPAVIGKIGQGDQSIIVRQAGDHAVLLEFGEEDAFSLFQSLRIFAFIESHKKNPIDDVLELSPGVRSLHIAYTRGMTPNEILVKLAAYHFEVPHQVPSRTFRLPIVLDDIACKKAVARYAATIRSEAPWLPNNTKFLEQLNGLEEGGVQDILLKAEFLVLGLGDVFLGSPCAVPLDPRHRLFGTKYNPSRSFTPSGAVGIGGQYMCIYGGESPGGYQLVGRTVDVWDQQKLDYDPDPCDSSLATGGNRPWRFRLFDRISFYQVQQDDLEMGKDLVQVEEDTMIDLDTYNKWSAEIKNDVDVVMRHRREAIANAPFLDQLLQPAPEKVNTTGSGTTSLSSPEVGKLIRAVVPGRCFKLAVQAGDTIEAGDSLLWIESNKMEIKISSPLSGKIAGVRVSAGDSVMPDDVLMVITE